MDVQAVIQEIDQNIALLQKPEASSIRSIEVGKRLLTFTSFDDGIFKLTFWRDTLQQYMDRLIGNKRLFDRDRVTGVSEHSTCEFGWDTSISAKYAKRFSARGAK